MKESKMMDVSTPACLKCGLSSVVEVDREGWLAYRRGIDVFDALPELSNYARNMLLHGSHLDC